MITQGDQRTGDTFKGRVKILWKDVNDKIPASPYVEVVKFDTGWPIFISVTVLCYAMIANRWHGNKDDLPSGAKKLHSAGTHSQFLLDGPHYDVLNGMSDNDAIRRGINIYNSLLGEREVENEW